MAALHRLEALGSGSLSLLLMAAGVVSVLSLSVALCASHSRKRAQQKFKSREEEETVIKESSIDMNGLSYEPKSPKGFLSNVSFNMRAKKLQAAEAKEEAKEKEKEANEGSSIWQRTIMMGEKCRPPNFSGAIIYDDKGNLLPHFPPRSSYSNPPPASVNRLPSA